MLSESDGHKQISDICIRSIYKAYVLLSVNTCSPGAEGVNPA